MIHNCETCGRIFEGRSHARFCSGACRAKAQRLRADADGEPVYSDAVPHYGMSMAEVEGVVLRAHQTAGDMSRAAMFTEQPLSGALGRCAASFECALRREGL